MKKVLQSIFVGLLFGLTVMGGPVNADYQIKDGNGTTQTIDAFTCATSKICPGYVPMDYTGAQFGVTGNPFFINFASGATLPPFASTPTFNCGTGCSSTGGTFNNNSDGVATSSTNGQNAGWLYGYNGTTWDRVRTDTTNGVWANIKSSVLPTGASTAAKQPALGTAGSASTDVLTVQGIASMTPFLTNPGTASNWGVQTQGSLTSGQSGHLVQGAVTSASPTYGNAQTSPLSLDTSGNLRVNVVTGGAGGGAVYGPTAVGSANANPPVVIGGTATGAAGQNVEGVAVKPASTASVATDLSLVTNESPNSQLSVTAGTTADSAYAGSGSASIIAALKGIYASATGAVPAGTNTIGNFGFDPSSGKGTPASVAINVSTATTTQLVALSGSTKIYVTSFDVIAGGTGNITFEYGTGTACATGTTVLTGAYNLTAQAGIAKGNGAAPVLIVPAGNALCVLTSAAVQMSGSASYQQF